MALTQIPPVMIDGELGLDWQSSVETSSFTAVNGNGYFVNTTSGSITVTMPSSPIAGDSIGIIDYAGTTSTNKIILTSSNNIEGASNDKVVNYTRGALRITYADTTQGWVASAAANEGTSALNPNTSEVDFLVVAGGGGGGMTGGGGGAGGLRTSFGTSSGGGTSNESKIDLSPGTTYTITVGGGGTPVYWSSGAKANNGTDSSVSGSGLTTITSVGGGGGANISGTSAGNGGSGGGAYAGSNNPPCTPGNGTTNQGFAGGDMSGSASNYPGGGGGGAGAIGDDGSGGSTGGNGGTGVASLITGSSVTYAGGGGGGTQNGGTAGTGGAGGGGNGTNSNATGASGTTNTGGGAGAGGYGGGYGAGGTGGSGVVILRMATANYSGTTTGSPTITTNGTDTILKFTGDGTYTH